MSVLPYPTEVTEAPLGLDPRIRRFRCGDEVDTFVVVTERWLVIVDTHSTPALALQLAEQCVGPGDAGRLLVVNTHADYDHAWGNQVFSGPEARYPAPIIGHALCAERSAAATRSRRARRWRRSSRAGSTDSCSHHRTSLSATRGLRSTAAT